MHASWTTLPGETPIDDISGLRPRNITSRAALIVAEEEHVHRAVVKYLAARPSRRVAPFDLKWLKRLHREMLGQVWKWAGEIRQSEITFGVKTGSPPRQIESDLANLLEDLRVWEAASMPLIEQAARLHYRAVMIHPFTNGNGRWARMLANIWLKQHGAPVVEWPESGLSSVSPIRAEYLDAIRRMDNFDESAFIELHRRHSQSQT